VLQLNSWGIKSTINVLINTLNNGRMSNTNSNRLVEIQKCKVIILMFYNAFTLLQAISVILQIGA